MKRFLVLLLALFTLLPALAQAAPLAQATPSITTFTSTATVVDRAQLANRTARIPVSWATANRPNSANLVFEQILPDGRVMNVELPRDNPYVASSGNGVVAPFPPGEGGTSVTFRISLIDFVNLTVYDKKEITLPIGDSPVPTPTIESFAANATSISRTALTNKTARIPVSWSVSTRPENSNLVFEQVFEDNSIVNVELPRQNPIVPSQGLGVAAPSAPKNAATTSITLRLRLVNLSTNATITQKDITVAIDDAPAPTPTITVFSTSATGVNLAQLTNKTARVPVSWNVTNRPDGSNLVFEQILEDNSVVNVELPRQNPFVSSSGDGVAAPVAPKNTATTSITLRVRLVNLSTNATLVQKDLTLPILSGQVVPVIRSYTTTATSVSRAQLTNRSARIPVSWAVDNRPQNSNLVFEQVLANGGVINVELPRQNPLVSSSGNGVVSPALPGGTATSVTLRLRVIDLTTQATLAEQSINLPISDTTPTASIRSFATTATTVDNATLVNRTARVPVSWAVDNRPEGSALVFEQVFEDGSVINVELPRQNPFVSSSGIGVVAPAAPKQTTTPNITIRLRVVGIGSGTLLAEATLTVPIAGRTPAGNSGGNTGGDNAGGTLEVNSFSGSPNPAERGGAVTLSWNTNAASVRIERLGETDDASLETIASGQPGTGTFVYTLPEDYLNAAPFVLIATGANGQEINQRTEVAINCPFSEILIEEGCPFTQKFQVNSAFQSFEKGVMVWRGDELSIYVLFNDGTWQEFPDTWSAGDPDPVPGEPPPVGLFVPVHGFGKVWEQLGGFSALGWATAEEVSYLGQWETYPLFDGGLVAYTPHFTLPDGRAAHLGMQWSID
ncbi:MAG: hypothetical protein K8L97_27040 [Anaerolineae bacterium]|nr:hypothetical protein [Anaerolineae bacterium]